MVFIRALLALAVAGVFGFASFAAVAETNFDGKTITIIVPFKEGGGTDTYARIIAPHLAKNLPGSPKVVILNKPGGGSVRGANDFQRAKPDGMTVLAVSTSTQTNAVFGGSKIKYDVGSWVPIMLNPQGTFVYASPGQTGVTGKDIRKDVEALRKAKVLMGAKTSTSAELRIILSLDLLGISPDVVLGLSSGQWRKAVLRGELNLGYANATTWFTKLLPWEKKGTVALFMTFGILDESGNIVRDPVMKDAPTFVDAYREMNGKDPSGPQFEVLKNFIAMGVNASKALVLPKGTSSEIRDAYVAAAKQAFADPVSSAEFKKKLGDYQPTYGKEAAAIFEKASNISPANKKWMDDWIDQRFGGKKS